MAKYCFRTAGSEGSIDLDTSDSEAGATSSKTHGMGTSDSVEHDYCPSLDEILKLPELDSDGRSKDDLLDLMDKEIAEGKLRHDEEMSRLDSSILNEKKRQEERKCRLKDNALLRDRFEVEVSESLLKEMFRKNLQYLKDVRSGKVFSARHQAYHQSSQSRHKLFYTMITDPCTEDQLDWILEEFGKVWMRNKKEQLTHYEHIWKVMIPEIIIKIYMDHFGFTKREAEIRISETPLKNDGTGDSGDEL